MTKKPNTLGIIERTTYFLVGVMGNLLVIALLFQVLNNVLLTTFIDLLLVFGFIQSLKQKHPGDRIKTALLGVKISLIAAIIVAVVLWIMILFADQLYRGIAD